MIIIILATLVTIFSMYILVYYGVQNEQYAILIRWFQWWTIILVMFMVILHKKRSFWHTQRAALQPPNGVNLAKFMRRFWTVM